MSIEIDLADPQILRALAHPTRIRILRFVQEQAPATATQVSAGIGESVASCSYHLRILAKYGFVKPAENRTGREKPWVAESWSGSLSTIDMPDADRARADAMARAGRQSFFEQLERWSTETYSHPRDWQAASFSIGYGMHVTAAELLAARKELAEVLDRYSALGRDRPDTAHVVLQAWGFPVPGHPEQFEAATETAG